MRKRSSMDVKRQPANDKPNGHGRATKAPKAPKPEEKFRLLWAAQIVCNLYKDDKPNYNLKEFDEQRETVLRECRQTASSIAGGCFGTILSTIGGEVSTPILARECAEHLRIPSSVCSAEPLP
jgi:hypothetical protein